MPDGVAVRGLGGEQSNTSIAFGDLLVLKQFRRLRPGINPEEEITRFLTERTPFRHAPRLLGSLAYEPSAGEAGTLAVAHEFVAGAEDGWHWMLAELRRWPRGSERRRVSSTTCAGVPRSSLGALRRLGERAGQLHVALASDPRDPDFAPEPITEDDVRGWADGVHRQIEAARSALGGRLPVEVPDVALALAGLVGAMKIRQHGDFHLGQTLYRRADADFAIVDFEGEPLRPLAERRRKHAAMRDVAGLRRSISYAAAAEHDGSGAPWREIWEAEGQRAFVDGYLDRDAPRALHPGDAGGLRGRGGRVRAGEGRLRDRLRGQPPARVGGHSRAGPGQRGGSDSGGGIFCLGVNSMVVTSHPSSSKETKRPSSYM